MTHTYKLLLTLSLVLAALTGRAQYGSTRLNGNISSAEYNGRSYTSVSGGTWYMTWNADSLYIAKTSGGTGEPNYVYLDVNPAIPVTGGSNANGSITGNPDYDVTPKVPFRADARIFFTDTYVEIRRTDGAGGWSSTAINGGNQVAIRSSGSNRELRLAWSALTGGGSIPQSFNWLGYASNTNTGAGNYRYDSAPTNQNANSTTGGATPPLEYYYTVLSTLPTASADVSNPFARVSYTFPGTGTVNNFGSIQVWDFTMNTENQYLSRGSTGGDWTINGSLVVGDGIVYFGSGTSNYGNTNVGNIRMTGGVLSMDESNRPLNVNEDVVIAGGQFILSGAIGGDLNVGRNFTIASNATTLAPFRNSQRAVTFTGNNASHAITSNGGGTVTFGYLTMNSPGGSLTLNNNISVLNGLNFVQGNILTGNNTVLLDGSSGTVSLNNESAASHIIGRTQISQTVYGSGSGTSTFGNIGFSLTPQPGTASLGQVTVTRTTGTARTGVGPGNGGNSITRSFALSGITGSLTDLNLQLTLGYRTDELNGISQGNLALYQSNTGTAPYTRLTSPPSANTGNRTVTYTGALTLSQSTVFTLADGIAPLPVTFAGFTASLLPQGTAQLRWKTASELNNKGFNVERQLEGSTTWQAVGYVTGSNLATGSSYDFIDTTLPSVVAGVKVYYRLRQEDIDGTFAYSPVLALARATNAELSLSPVPVSGGNLTVTFAEANQQGLEVAVTDMNGRRVLHLTTSASTDAALQLPVDNLAAGVYVLSVQVPGQAPRHARFVRK